MSGGTRVVVLIKDFDAAKERLSAALSPRNRRNLAVSCAIKALTSAGPGAIVVAGSEAVGEMASRFTDEVVVEAEPGGQRAAARLGIARAVELGAGAVLVLSSDMPRITLEEVTRMRLAGEALPPPVVLAAPAIGRGGTNALFLNPPDAVEMFYGEDSLAGFSADADARGVRFERFESDALALDLDEPEDLSVAGPLDALE